MKFLQRFIKSIKVRRVLSIIIFTSISSVLLLGYLFINKRLDIKIIALILFAVVIGQVFVLQYFFKNQLKNDVIKRNLKDRVKKLNENLEEANKLVDYKSAYLANMSYDIRTPLSTVLGMLNMLKMTDLDDNQRAQTEIAEYSSRHLLQLVNMVSNNKDVSLGEVKLNNLAFDLKADLTHLFKVFEFQAWEKELHFEYKFLLDEKQRFSLLGDSIRIQQVLVNLINNALKFTNAGVISIIVDQTISIDDDQIVTFYIKDTGIGLKPHEIKQIFDDSKNDSNSFNGDYRGGGLGLSIAHQLVKLMGGELKLETKENEGSTFYFSLQLKKTLNLKTEAEIAQPVLSEKFNVLVAEDNRTSQKIIKFLLEQQGADCTFVKNGLEAVELYKILDFDMVFMDIYMPDMDGYDATKAIKATEKYLKNNTPIIAVSASAFEEDIENAKLAGIDEFLAKPIEVPKLKALLIKYSNGNASVSNHELK